MSKTRIKYICSTCGYESLRWLGKCPECDNWNTFTEEIIETNNKKVSAYKGTINIKKIDELEGAEKNRIITGIGELDRVLGGGFIPGSVILLGGDPGIGKSTLAMQAASKINHTVLYVTGEESTSQIKTRAARLKIKSDNFYVLSETDLNIIIAAINSLSPSLVIIDSIQTMYRNELDNSPGTITQIRECTSQLMETAKKNNISILIVGHVTKEGFIAGPKVLEHMVDTVIQFEGESHHAFRILRAQKNRFGSTNEIGIFEMHEDGLTEVKNPSEVFLSERDKEISGSAITASIEGTRPILLEVQALVTPSNFGNPQRVATGFDYRRLSILLAVLEKRSGLRLSANNVFLNMAGGVKIDEPAIDLAVCCSIASSLMDKVVNSKTVLIGEVGLGGEVRSVGHIEKRIQEAEKLGFEKVLIPLNNIKGLKVNSSSIKITGVESLTEAINGVIK
ncbi:MAG: DNA repair protein RadA [Ignavibacteria bacterium RBG_16_34_14]|nr:MAG: DNA repair protein RadA [Ignavibacteria bacterium RBG_16_34_14]